jgi:branched-chain amino acid aminotransferase
MPQTLAIKKGYSQVLWLFGQNHQVTEAGTMNFFVFWINKKGEKELITAPLDGTILPGVTRDSIIYLCKQWNEFKVSEEVYTVHDIIDAVKENRVRFLRSYLIVFAYFVVF